MVYEAIFTEYQNSLDLIELAVLVPWGSNILIMSKVKDIKAREYYLRATAQMGWSRSVLLNQIKGEAYERHALEPKIHNFESTLPVHLAEQADETIKSSYNLDFLGINAPVLERELENRMLEKLKEVIIELGYGFCFVGSQYKIQLNEDKNYKIDLLFFHRKLQCLVAVELKVVEFEAEFAGKMNLYLNILDKTVKLKHENPSIGIIVCAEKDNLEVEYALKDINKPIGVVEYQLTKKLPERLKGQLPSIEDIKKKVIE